MHVTFEINKALDKEVMQSFWGTADSGYDYTREIIDVHPELKDVKNINDIHRHFDSFYKKHNDYLQTRVKIFQEEWNTVEKQYIDLITLFFKKHPWPNGKYTGYISIINCNPRFLKEKTFQIFFFHPEGSILPTMHEVTHFMFYDYCIKTKPDIFQELDQDNGIFWDLAEIFNSIFLSQTEFLALHKITDIQSYPIHTSYIPDLKVMWEKNTNIDSWINSAWKYLSDN